MDWIFFTVWAMKEFCLRGFSPLICKYCFTALMLTFILCTQSDEELTLERLFLHADKWGEVFVLLQRLGLTHLLLCLCSLLMSHRINPLKIISTFRDYKRLNKLRPALSPSFMLVMQPHTALLLSDLFILLYLQWIPSIDIKL